MNRLTIPPSDHDSEEFKKWITNMKAAGYTDPYIAAISGESVKRIRKITGQIIKKRENVNSHIFHRIFTKG